MRVGLEFAIVLAFWAGCCGLLALGGVVGWALRGHLDAAETDRLNRLREWAEKHGVK